MTPQIRVNIHKARITLRCIPTPSVLSGYRCVQYIVLNNGIHLKAILSWV